MTTATTHKALNTPESIKGNVSDDVKAFVSGVLTIFMDRGDSGFADRIGARIKVVDISVNQHPNASKRKEGVVVCELEVEQGELACVLSSCGV